MGRVVEADERKALPPLAPRKTIHLVTRKCLKITELLVGMCPPYR